MRNDILVKRVKAGEAGDWEAARVTANAHVSKCRRYSGDALHGSTAIRKLQTFDVAKFFCRFTSLISLKLFGKAWRMELVSLLSASIIVLFMSFSFSSQAATFAKCSNWNSFGPPGESFWKNIDLDGINFCLQYWSSALNEMRDYSEATVLHRAVKGSSPEVVEMLIKSGSNVNARALNGVTPLHYANVFCSYSDYERLPVFSEMTKLLINAGANIHDQSNGGNLPLHFAAQGCSSEATTLLFNAGASPHSVNYKGETPLHRAVDGGNLNAVVQLLLAGADPGSKNLNGDTPISMASSIVDVNKQRAILAELNRVFENFNGECKDWNFTAFWQELANEKLVSCLNEWMNGNKIDTWGVHPLHFAVVKGRMESVRTLFTSINWDLPPADVVGNTPLHWAALLKNTEDIHVLIDLGVNLDSTNMQGMAALHYSVARGDIPIINALLLGGANIDIRDDYGRTPLHIASQDSRNKNLLLIDFLIQAGANPNLRDINGESPLFVATDILFPEYNWKLIEALIANGSDPNTRNDYGEAPLHRIALGGHRALIKMFAEAGAKPNVRDKHGVTPLHIAATYIGEYGRGPSKITALISVGANPNAQDNSGNTPLHYAARSEFSSPEAIKVLLKNGANACLRNKYGESPANLAEGNVIFQETTIYWELRDSCYN